MISNKKARQMIVSCLNSNGCQFKYSSLVKPSGLTSTKEPNSHCLRLHGAPYRLSTAAFMSNRFQSNKGEMYVFTNKGSTTGQ